MIDLTNRSEARDADKDSTAMSSPFEIGTEERASTRVLGTIFCI